MDVARWQHIERIYFDVLDGRPEDRAALLDRLCPHDSELRREVESLLAARDTAGGFLSAAGLVRQISELETDVGVSVPATLGPYQLLERIGAGGMGEVYRARDSRLARDVALKILPAAFVSDASRVARFNARRGRRPR